MEREDVKWGWQDGEDCAGKGTNRRPGDKHIGTLQSIEMKLKD